MARLLCLAIVAGVGIGCSRNAEDSTPAAGNPESDPIVGKWESDFDDQGRVSQNEYFADGSGITYRRDGQIPFTWSWTDDHRLKLDTMIGPIIFEAKFSKNDSELAITEAGTNDVEIVRRVDKFTPRTNDATE